VAKVNDTTKIINQKKLKKVEHEFEEESNNIERKDWQLSLSIAIRKAKRISFKKRSITYKVIIRLYQTTSVKTKTPMP